jgi:Ni,Fe-hydrogenase III small subunit
LQPSARAFPLVVIAGPVTSAVHVAILAAVEVFPHASIAVNVLVCEREQILVTIAPSINVTVGVEQASVAVAVPNAPSIVAVEGLQPSARAFPLVVIAGPVTSAVHVAILAAVEVLPHASIAVNVLVCEREQILVTIAPSINVTVGVEQASVEVAVPNAPPIVPALGLQPSASGLPLVVIVGPAASAVHVTVLEAVAVLLQTSIAVHVLVCDREQEVVTIEPSLGINVEPPQLSVAVAVPSAALISLATGYNLRSKLFLKWKW